MVAVARFQDVLVPQLRVVVDQLQIVVDEIIFGILLLNNDRANQVVGFVVQQLVVQYVAAVVVIVCEVVGVCIDCGFCGFCCDRLFDCGVDWLSGESFAFRCSIE